MKITLNSPSPKRELVWKDVPINSVVSYRNTLVAGDGPAKLWLKTDTHHGVKLDSGVLIAEQHMARTHYRYTIVQAELVVTP